MLIFVGLTEKHPQTIVLEPHNIFFGNLGRYIKQEYKQERQNYLNYLIHENFHKI